MFLRAAKLLVTGIDFPGGVEETNMDCFENPIGPAGQALRDYGVVINCIHYAMKKRDEDEAQKYYKETTMKLQLEKPAVVKHHTLESRGPLWDLIHEWCFATAEWGVGPAYG